MYIIAAKGAPEAVADLCHFDEAGMRDLAQQVSAMASEGLRVLGVAKASFKKTELPDGQHDFLFEFLGLIGLADPVRPAVPAAIKECYSAGIRVVMITGDYPGTARSIAGQAGLAPVEEVITGPELDEMDDLELQRRLKTVNIFARVVPEQKLRLVDALKANGEIVAMTGDGVNANLGLILTNLSWSSTILNTMRKPNAALWWVSGGALIFLVMVLFVPFLRELFRFAQLHPIDLGICLAAGVVSILWFEGLKLIKGKEKSSKL
ncbi:MAG: Calcium-transporting ATPase 1 [Pelotomaculum sp. PtaB.Bin013]|nr:MAG: Calcium-transporting ATPase 1 [Pelotomaculum sp. PtaB.Bin013]